MYLWIDRRAKSIEDGRVSTGRDLKFHIEQCCNSWYFHLKRTGCLKKSVMKASIVGLTWAIGYNEGTQKMRLIVLDMSLKPILRFCVPTEQ